MPKYNTFKDVEKMIDEKLARKGTRASSSVERLRRLALKLPRRITRR